MVKCVRTDMRGLVTGIGKSFQAPLVISEAVMLSKFFSSTFSARSWFL